MPAQNLKKLLRRLIWRIQDDSVFGRAAQLSYYFLLALFPLLLFFVSLLGHFAQAGSQLRNSLISYLSAIMPPAAVTLVHTAVDEVSTAAGGGKMSLGLLAALWAASNGMGAISDTLNAAYNVKETRPWWRVRLISVLLTIMLTVLIVLALAIMFYGGTIGDAIAASFGFSKAFTTF